MKVLQIDVFYGQGSTGKIVECIHRSLLAEGHESFACYGRGDRAQEPNVRRIAPPLEVLAHVALSRVTGLFNCFSPVATRRAIACIEAFKPDVVHLHDVHGYFINIDRLVRYLAARDIRVLWTFHCEYMYTGKCGHAYDCERWKSECRDCPQLGEYPRSLLLDFTRRMHRTKKRNLARLRRLSIAVPSSWLGDRVAMSFLSSRAIRVVLNGLDADGVFAPKDASELRRRHAAGNRRVVLMVAANAMTEAKGGAHFIELARRMAEESVLFILIGVEPSEARTEGNLAVLPRIDDQGALALYYSMADLCVICSKRETFSMTTAESLCCGTPVVGYRAGAPEAIALSEYSEFVENGDLGALEASVRRWLGAKGDGGLSREIAEKANARYSKQAMYEAYLLAYRDLLEAK